VTATAYRIADRIVGRITTVTICVSERERRLGVAARTCGADRTVVIHNGVPSPAVARRGERSDGRARIITVGRLQAPKDPVTFVRALARLAPDSFTATLVGDGPDREAVEAEVRRLGLAERVKLAGDRRDVPELLAEGDVFVLSTASEGLPMSILEAMAAGLPVVASHVGGIPEVVEDGRTGLLVPPGDDRALAAAIGRLVADPGLQAELGRAGHDRARRCFAVEVFRRSHVDLYRRELAARGLPLPPP
jgi:glycosyltransferase involved in cell wall biosynthesis